MARSADMSQATSRVRQQPAGFFGGDASVVAPRIVFVVAVLLLTIVGLVMVFSASTIEALNAGQAPWSYLVKQAAIAAASIVVALGIAVFIPYYRWLGPLLAVFWVGVVALLLLTAIIGTAELGAQRWVNVGPVSFQPSEFAKLAFVLVAANIMYRMRAGEITLNTMLVQGGIFVLAPLLMLYATQSDFGTTLICMVGIIAVLWLADIPWKPIVIFLVAGVLFVVVAVFAVGYRSDRLTVLADPKADYYGNGYQLVRSFYAFGNGGLFGVGLGNSTEKYLYLPEAETDFIFAIIAEELGVVGALAVIVLFLVVLVSGLRIAAAAPDLLGTMIAGACTTMLVFQALLNIGCVTGLLPTTGKPLPFISSGGSSLLGSYLLVGAVLSVSLVSGGDSPVYERRRDDFELLTAAPAQSSRSSRQGTQRYRTQSAKDAQGASGKRMGGLQQRVSAAAKGLRRGQRAGYQGGGR